MKKLLTLCLAILLSLTVLAGCSKGNEPEVENKRDTVTKIAVLLPGSITDQSWNYTAYQGLMQIKDKYGLEVAYTENVSAEKMVTTFRTYCEEGYDFVIGHGAQYGDACAQVAAEFKNVNFFITGNAPEDIPEAELPKNIMFADYRECEGSYVCGVVAALMTESKVVGYIGGGNNTTQQSDKNAFIDGVKSVDATIEVLTVITGTFDDSDLGKTTATAMIKEKGADVILQTCDHTGLGALEACNELGVFCLGYTTDQSSLVAEGLCLTSMLIDIPYMISSQVELIKAGNYGGQSFPGLHDGVVSMSAFSSKVPAEIAAKVNAVIDDIKAGKTVITPNYSEN